MEYTKKFFDSIEYRNGEFNSFFYGTDYLKGLQIKNLMYVIRNLDIKYFMDAVRLKFIDKRLCKYQKRNKGNYTVEYKKIDTYNSYLLLKDKKIVIYTCISGGYDYLKEPLLEFCNVEYVCFTDSESNISKADCSKWTIKKIPESIIKSYGKIFSNRYIKMHPKELFPDADYAIYVDGNIGIYSFLGSYAINTNTKTGIAIFSHSQRQCAYVESEICISRKKGNKEAIKHQMQEYDKIGFPKNFGLYECTIIAIDLYNPLSTEIMDKWWEEFLHSQSHRDQLSLPYVIWKGNMRYTDIGLLGENIFNDCKITVYGHNDFLS